MDQNLSSAIKLLSVLARLQRWEALNLNLLRTASGRQIYFGLIRHLTNDHNKLLVNSMKNINYDDGVQLTERGVRLTMRAFEADGVVVIEQDADDRRSKRIYLTDKLQRQMFLHAEVMEKMLSEDFLLLIK